MRFHSKVESMRAASIPPRGPLPRSAIGNYGIAQPGVFFRVANDSGATGSRLNQSGILLDQSDAVDLQESLVRPHPRAVPARQDVTGYAHAEMIALKFVPISR